MPLTSLDLTNRKRSMLFVGLVSAFLLAGVLLSQTFVAKASAETDLNKINAHVESALTAAQAGDMATAQKEYKAFADAWFGIEDGVKDKSKDAYRVIEDKMSDVKFAFSKSPVNQKEVTDALTALSSTNQSFIKGDLKAFTAPTPAASAATTAPNASSSASSESKTTIAVLLGKLDEARDLLAEGNYAAAATEVKEFQEGWLDVEGQVKTRSADDYVQTENDMGLAYSLLTQNSAEARAVIDRMYNRLEPYTNAGQYGIFDAAIILLREGLEALLVVVALLTFLKKSGNARKQGWIWGGAGAGLALSIALGVAIQLLFSNIINSSNREMIEGFIGLFAAVMLLYVSYWMHNKASIGAWQRYIRQKSTAALATGSLFGLGLLSFLAIFREGAETVLFYLGIGPSISAPDLWIGMGIGTLILVIIGVLLVVIGLRIPMRPFFTVASLLVFYLCFKFIGTGIHALQIAGLLPTHSADYLPSNDFLGLYPTWESTIVQAVVLVAALAVVIYGRVKKVAPEKAEQPKTSTPISATK